MPMQATKLKVSTSNKRADKILLKVKDAHDKGQIKRADHFSRLYLNSLDAKYAAAVEANRTAKRHRKVKNKKLMEVALAMTPWSGTNEEATVHFKPKKSNPHDFRPIIDFGIENRALQHLVLKLLRVRSNTLPCQFAVSGGRLAAANTVLDALVDGYLWVAELDISDCYPSFNHHKIANLLPLPKEVTNNNLTCVNLNLSLGNLTQIFGFEGSLTNYSQEEQELLTSELFMARRGIPQGSAVSPLVTEMLLSSVFSKLPANGKVVNYADNFLVMSQDEKGMVSIIKTLRAALLGHPAGPLQPKIMWYITPNENFDFLGFTYSQKLGNYIVSPTMQNLHKFEKRFKHDYHRIQAPSISANCKKDRILRLRKYVCGWTAGFSVWAGSTLLKNEKLAAIEAIEHVPVLKEQIAKYP